MLPTNFKEYLGGPIIANVDNLIDAEIEAIIKNEELFSRYAAWDFNAKIWWNDNLGYWFAEIWVFREYITSYMAETLEELANEVNIAWQWRIS